MNSQNASLISESYLNQQKKLHENPNYGVASISFAPFVTQLINKLGILELTDYGCGKGRLAENITPDHPINIQMYDPAREGYNDTPRPTQMVCCIDVLEHIEPDLIDNVFDDLRRVTKEVGFFTIHTGPAIKILDDGRNAHLIQEDMDWWLPKIMDRFKLNTVQRTDNGFWVLVE